VRPAGGEFSGNLKWKSSLDTSLARTGLASLPPSGFDEGESGMETNATKAKML
jgi:hypothetical protein